MEQYVGKLDELKKYGDEIEFRVKEAERRSEVITAARDKIASIQGDAGSGPEIEKYSHIEQVTTPQHSAMHSAVAQHRGAAPTPPPPCTLLLCGPLQW